MAKSNSFVWQLRILMIVLAAGGSFWFGLTLPFKQSSGQSIPLKDSLMSLKSKVSPNHDIEAATLEIESQDVFSHLSTRLVNLEKEYNFTVPAYFQSKTIENVALASGEKVIALTFDDGPWPKSTNDVLYILDKYQIKATFFVVGRNVQYYPQLMQKIVKHGHALGNHSWNHYYHYHNPSAAAREIDNTTARVYKTTGVKMSLFRPPGGVLNNGLANYARKKKQVVVMWDADSQDYRVSAHALKNNVLRYAKPGGIVLMHDGGGDRSRTVSVLPEIISELKKQGYRFVTVPELLEMKRQELEAIQG